VRGHHERYIADVNAATTPWYTAAPKRGRVVSTVNLVYMLPDGRYEIPAGTISDLFSCVPDTGYIEFHKSALLHDTQRADKDIPRQVSDYNFAWDMHRRIEHIRRVLMLHTDCPLPVVNREVIRLTRIAAVYSLGVSGAVGSLFIKLDKWF
jgi:hypothetical protein